MIVYHEIGLTQALPVQWSATEAPGSLELCLSQCELSV